VSRLAETFAHCRSRKRAAFIPFLMAGDPDARASLELIGAAIAGGADIVELGMPFSDPIADGSVNQRAHVRGLSGGATMAGVLDIVAQARGRWDVPFVLYSYFNPILRLGVSEFSARAAASGLDGVLALDLPPEEAVPEFVDTMEREGLDPIFLLAPTSTKARIRRVDRLARGFVYYVARTGVTGVRQELPPELLKEARAIRKAIRSPLAVGFGISTPEQVEQVGSVADGVVVGSALVRLVEEHGAAAADLLTETVASLTEPLRRPRKGWLRR